MSAVLRLKVREMLADLKLPGALEAVDSPDIPSHPTSRLPSVKMD